VPPSPPQRRFAAALCKELPLLEYLRSWLARRSPQPEQPLPEHGVLYFNHLYSEYRYLLTSSTTDQSVTISPEVQTLVDELLKKSQNLSLTWNDL
jgi:hypothetical protein